MSRSNLLAGGAASCLALAVSPSAQGATPSDPDEQRQTPSWTGGDIVVTGRRQTYAEPDTSAGVTSALDFGLTMVAEMRDRTYAECTQLMSEYDPRPNMRPYSHVNCATLSYHGAGQCIRVPQNIG